MRKGISCIAGATVSLLFAFSGVASADVTLGNVTPPTGSDPGTCFQGPGGNDAFAQLTDDPSAPYTVPAGGGAIGSWETNTAGDAPGTPLTLVILRPTSGGSFTVVGVDNETLPSPLPANNIATFTLSTPIVVQAGDKLALYSSIEDTPGAPVCYFNSGATPLGSSLFALTTTSAPAPGQTLSPDTTVGSSGPGYMLNVAATVTQAADLSVTKAASAPSVTLGNAITYTIQAHNAGPSDAGSATVTDSLPSHVTFVSASSTQGSCSGTTTVSCSLGTLANGASATVTIKVTAKTTGKATNTATVSSSVTDSNTANNKASATTTIKPKPLRLVVSPHRGNAGVRACYRFTATSGGRAVRGVTVRFAGHSAHTSKNGKAQICVSLKRGVYHAHATKKGLRAATATVRIRAATRRPVFTG